jgi:hypothetical protein
MPTPLTALLLLTLLACVAAAPADAALKVDSGATGAKLVVDARGHAQVSWTSAGTRRTAVITGSSVRYGGGIGASTGVRVTPTVPFALAQIRLPDGTQFALQQLQRTGQFGKLGPSELYLARWRGDPTELTLTREGQRICGTVTYHGAAVYGTVHTRSGNPLDALGRNVYLDSLRPSGWYRMLGVLSRPRGYAFLVRPEWQGSRYRALIVGPNVAGDLAPVASAETMDAEGTCPFPSGTYAGA